MPRATAEDRRILALALPALGALIAEPLFLLADSLIVARLGTVPLAGLGLAGGLLSGVVGLCVFLAYGTTASVARSAGAGRLRDGLAAGLDGLWLAIGLGVLILLVGLPSAPTVVSAFDVGPDVAAQAVTYLRWSLPGVPGMLAVLAATGILRGVQDTRTPLLVAASGAVVNAGLNVLLVHGAGLGIAGSAIGTSATQVGMAVVVGAVVLRAARRGGVPLRVHAAGMRAALGGGVPLLVRTLALRAVLLTSTAVAGGLGAAALAAHQVVTTVWILTALAHDALAIAAQALTGTALGAGDVAAARGATRRTVRWGLLAGVLVAGLVLAGRDVIAAGFGEDPAVREAISAALVVLALAQPLAAYVFVLDGVLIGAGDGRYLAWASAGQYLLFLPAGLAVARTGPGGTVGLVLLWVALAGGHTLARAVTLGLRVRGDAWMVLGPGRARG